MQLPVVIPRRPEVAVRHFQFDIFINEKALQVVAAGLLERAQINEGLGQRADRPLRIKCAVEAGETRIAIANHRQHFAAFDRRHHPGGLQGIRRQLAALFQFRKVGNYPRFQRFLHARVECGEDAQTLAVQIILTIQALQLPPHQIDISRVAFGAAGRNIAHTERPRQRHLEFVIADQFRVGHLAKHQIAPLLDALCIASRVVDCRPLGNADEQGNLLRPQLVQRLVEIELAGETEAVDRPATVLPEPDLVEISLQDLFLADVPFQQDRHQRFPNLAAVILLVGQKQVAHKLLRDRTAALLLAAVEKIVDEGAQDAGRTDANVIFEIAVFDLQQCRRQQRRHIFDADEYPVLAAVTRIDAADQHRIEPQKVDRLVATHAADRGEAGAVAAHGDPRLVLRTVPECEGARVDAQLAAGGNVSAGANQLIATAIAETIKLVTQRRQRDARAGVELERCGVDLSRQDPAHAGKTIPHVTIEPDEIDREGDSTKAERDDETDQQPAQKRRFDSDHECANGSFFRAESPSRRPDWTRSKTRCHTEIAV